MTIHDLHRNGTDPDAPDLALVEPLEVDDDVDASPPSARTGTAPRRVPVVPPGPRRKYDYRLRGLDLDALERTDPPVPHEVRRRSNLGRRGRRLLVQAAVILGVLALVAVVLRVAVVRPYSVQSTSMVPTIWPDTDVLVATSGLLAGQVERGDVVVLRQPDGATCAGTGNPELVSRVIGLPGETIWSEAGRIFIDGVYLDRPSWHNPPYGEVASRPVVRTTIPKGSYFVMGDNRTDTCDSRVFGPVAGSALVGEVLASTMRDGHPHVRGL